MAPKAVGNCGGLEPRGPRWATPQSGRPEFGTFPAFGPGWTISRTGTTVVPRGVGPGLFRNSLKDGNYFSGRSVPRFKHFSPGTSGGKKGGPGLGPGLPGRKSGAREGTAGTNSGGEKPGGPGEKGDPRGEEFPGAKFRDSREMGPLGALGRLGLRTSGQRGLRRGFFSGGRHQWWGFCGPHNEKGTPPCGGQGETPTGGQQCSEPGGPAPFVGARTPKTLGGNNHTRGYA